MSTTSSGQFTNIVPNFLAFVGNALNGRRQVNQAQAVAETAQANMFFENLHRKQAAGLYNIPVDKT